MKIMKVSISVILCALLCGLIAEPLDNGLPSKGPKPWEKGRYVYSEDGVHFKHCLYCDYNKTFKNDQDNARYQETICVQKYNNFVEEISPYERENKLYPVCKIGKTPGCGPPPEQHKKAEDTWICDPGFSNKNYSVYFSCTLVNKRSKAVTRSYYCNESLQWDEDLNFAISPSNDETTVIGTDDGNYETVLIVSGVILILIVLVLTAVITCIIYDRNHRDSGNVEDSDSNSDLMNGHAPPVSSNGQGSMSSSHLDGSDTGNDDTGSKDADDKTEISDISYGKRLPPYGQEGPQSMGCQTACSFFSHYTNTNWENKGHPVVKATHTGVRAELEGSLISNHRADKHLSHVPKNSKFVNANNCQKKSVDINNLNKKPEHLQQNGAIRSQRPNPLGNITSTVCSDTANFDDEDDNRHNTELKQIVNARLTECKQSNNCNCSNNHLSQQSFGNTRTDISHQYTSQCTCAHNCESQCASQCACAMHSFERSNEMLDRQRFSHDQPELNHSDSFEIYSYQLKHGNEFYV